MNINILATEDFYSWMMRQLFPKDDPNEQFGFIITGLSKNEHGTNLLCRKFIFADKSCLIKQTPVAVAPDPRFTQYVWAIAKECNGGLITVHTHPFANSHVCFSGTDDRSEAESFPKEAAFLGNGPHANIVFGKSSLDARWYDPIKRQVWPINEFRIIGEHGTEVMYPTSLGTIDKEVFGVSEIHNRQVLAFGKPGQMMLQKQRVAIVGCGGIGSVMFVLLVRLGVRRFVLIDPDVVEFSNLNRLAATRLSDAENGTPKVEMLKNYGMAINPDIHVLAIAKSVYASESQFALRACDYVFGGLDMHSPRDLLNTLATQHMIPYIDTGTGLQSDEHHNIAHAGGQVRIVIPGMGCLKCIDGIDMDLAKMEQLPPDQRVGMVERGYIAGEDEHAPAVATLNGVIANLAVSEFLAYVTGFKPTSRYSFYNFLKPAVIPVEFFKKADCFCCSEETLLGCGDGGQMLPEYALNV